MNNLSNLLSTITKIINVSKSIIPSLKKFNITRKDKKNNINNPINSNKIDNNSITFFK